MSYTKHTWENGETITAEKLNNIEEGIEDSGETTTFFEIKVTNSGNYSQLENDGVAHNITGFTIDKNGKEIEDAFKEKKECYLMIDVFGNGKNIQKFRLDCIMSASTNQKVLCFSCIYSRHLKLLSIYYNNYPPNYDINTVSYMGKDMFS